MTHRCGQYGATSRWAAAAIIGVLGGSLTLLPAAGQERSRQSDSSSSQNASRQTSDDETATDEPSSQNRSDARAQDRSSDDASAHDTASQERSRSRDDQSYDRAQSSQRSQRQSYDPSRRTTAQDQPAQRFNQGQAYQSQQYGQTQYQQGQRSMQGQPATAARSSSQQRQYNQQQQPQYSQNQYGQSQYGQSQYGQSQYDRSSDRAAAIDRSRQAYDRGESRDQSQQDSASRDSAWLGVYLGRSQTAQGGVQVTQVYPAGPASRAGLRPGDVITAVNEQQVNSSSELIDAIEQEQPGSRAQLTILRNNQRTELPIVLGSRQSFAWSGWGGQQSSVDPAGGEGQFASESDRGHAREGGEEDYWSNVPPFAMQLEHERRMYEQHQRIETQIAQLQDEVRQLRELIQQQRR